MNTNNENTNEEIIEEDEKSMRDIMEEAIGEIEETDEAPEIAEKTEPEAKIEGEHVEETPEVEAKETKSIENANIEPEQQQEGKAPQSWSPKLREQFGKLDKSIQEQINKRETEIQKSLNDGAESRKFGEVINKTMEPYKALLAADGFNDPVQAINGFLQTTAQLKNGSPQQKAERLAQLIQHYGVDIEALDNVLAGNPSQNQNQNSELERLLEQKLAPVQQFMSTIQQNSAQTQQQNQQKAQQTVAEFEKQAEFIGDVRNDMADLLDMAAKRGQKMTLQQAYDKACAINPEINSVLQQRTNDARITGNANTLQGKRQSSSSLVGHRTGSGGGGGGDSIEAALNQAWDDQMRS